MDEKVSLGLWGLGLLPTPTLSSFLLRGVDCCTIKKVSKGSHDQEDPQPSHSPTEHSRIGVYLGDIR